VAAFIAVGTHLLKPSAPRFSRIGALLPAFLIATPFIWPTIYLPAVNRRGPERADRLLAVWPVLLILCLSRGDPKGSSDDAAYHSSCPFIIIAAIPWGVHVATASGIQPMAIWTTVHDSGWR